MSAQGPSAPRSFNIAAEWRLDTNERDLTSQAPLGDYTGIPFNEAGRLRSDTTPESIWGTPEYQCRPHSAPHQWRGLGGARILKEQDPLTRDVERLSHPVHALARPPGVHGRTPASAGVCAAQLDRFSTGEWVGNTLKITTTHLKDGYLRRGGPQTSDMYAMTEFITRHDDILTIVTVIDDPLYQDQPYIHSTTYTFDPTFRVNTETCNGPAVAENGGTDRHFVPHFLPGTNAEARESGSPPAASSPEGARRRRAGLGAAGGGPRRREDPLSGVSNDTERWGQRRSLTVPTMRSSISAAKMIADQSPRDGEVHVLPVQGNVYMLVADGTNITASVGQDGVALVNAGSAQMSDKLLAAVNQLVKATVTPAAPIPASGRTVRGRGDGPVRT